MIGEIAALSTALCWVVAARLFQILGGSFSASALNFWKGLVGILILLVVIQLFYPDVDIANEHLLWLLVSGAIGIGIGDTCFFKALNKIGDSQAILVAETLAPIFTGLLAMVWIAEWLTWQQWGGIALVLVAVDRVIVLQRKRESATFEVTGYFYAAGAAICQAVGAVISRDILTQTDLDPANSSLVRLIGGMVIVVVMMLVGRKRWLPQGENLSKVWGMFAIATVVGTFAALYLQMLAFSHTKAAIVQTLFATSVILSLGVAKVLGEPVSKRTIGWSLLALAGVSVLVLSELP